MSVRQVSINRYVYAMKHQFTSWAAFISFIQFAFLALVYSYQANGQNPSKTYQTKINGSIDNLNGWLHNGWTSGSLKQDHRLRFQEEKPMLVYGKRSTDFKPFSYRNEAGWSYSEAYVETLDGRLKKPTQPAFIVTGFAIPVDKINYKNLKFSAKKVIPSEEDKMLDWPYPNPPVIKIEINSLDKNNSFFVAKRYKPITGLDDSTIVEQVNKIDFYYPLYIRYHKEIDGNPDNKYIQEAMKMLKELFVNLELYNKSMFHTPKDIAE